MTVHPTATPQDLRAHPLAEAFPLLEGDAFTELVNDIRRHGLRENIMLLDGQILDGRNRYRACREAGVEMRFYDYIGSDPLAYVISKNAHRRHLTPEQKREIIAKVIEADPSRSNRQIAGIVKRDDKTVASVRAEMEDVRRIPHVAKRTDTKGRMQPAEKPAPAPSIDEHDTALAEGIALANNVRAAEAALMDAVRERMEGLRAFAIELYALSPDDRRAVLANIPEKDRKLIPRWRKINDEAIHKAQWCISCLFY